MKWNNKRGHASNWHKGLPQTTKNPYTNKVINKDMKFSELDFQPHPNPNWDGVQAKHFFGNGYGVSVIRSSHSYGGSDGLYELAVVK